ncbi:MAG: lamin tail domain-containing protein [Candidatus Nealsonbacteria bacterium]
MKDLSRGKALVFLILAGLLTAVFIAAEEKIDINTAPKEELIKIVHIGEARAEKLISLRPFSSLDDLTRINGLSELRVNDIKKQGLAWIGNNPGTIEKTAEPEPQVIIYPNNVVISELLPSPIGADAEEEWIEIHNQNNFAIDLFNWRLSDIEGQTTTYVFLKENTLGPKEFLVLERLTSKIVLNNNGDGLKLVRPDKSLANEISYQIANKGESFNLINNSWVWSAVTTPGKENIVPQPKKTEIKGEQVIPQSKELAAVSSQLSQKNKTSYQILAVASFLSVFFSIIILLLKKILKKGYNKNT